MECFFINSVRNPLSACPPSSHVSPFCHSAEPYGQGHTHRAHIKRRPLIMPLVALVQKNRAHQRLRTNTGAWGSLSRRRCSSRSIFKAVSARIRTLQIDKM